MPRKGEFYIGVILFLVSVGVMLESLRYRVGTAYEPQPGLFTFAAGLLLMGLSLTLIFKAGRGEPPKAQVLGNLRRPAQLILGLVVYISISSYTGYLLATTILSIIVLRAMEAKRWRVIIVGSLAVAVGSYIIFKLLLGLPLPRGTIFGLR
jgi:hypothetical protein